MLITPGKPTKLKQNVYLMAATILGLLLSLIAHALIEIGYLSRVQGRGISVTFYHGCALAPWLPAGLALIGAVGGFFLGRFWWRWIYVDRVWEKNPKYMRKINK